MSLKGFFTKLFTSKTEVETPSQQDDEKLKSAARNAVKREISKQKTENQKGEDTLPKKTRIHPSKNTENSANFDTPRIREILDEYNQHFFGAFKIDKSCYSLKLDNQNMIVEVNDKDFAHALSQSNKLSLSYEHIFLRLVQKEFKHFEARLYLRSGDSLNQHQKNIKELAHKLANRVKKTGQKATISAKSSYERSIIHQVVAKFPGLASKSVGPHYQRRLIIFSTDAKHSNQNKSLNKPNSQHAHE